MANKQASRRVKMGLWTTYKSNGDDPTTSTPTGESYTGNLDGKDYPVKERIPTTQYL